MPAEIGAGTGRNVEHSAKSVPIFGCEAARHQIHGFKDLWTYARIELRLRVIEKRHAVNKFMQRKLGPADGQKIIVAVARARHEVGDEIVAALQQWIGQAFKIFAGKSV